MIEDNVRLLAVNFAQQWNDLLKDHPRYRLDFSWPSLGTLDMLLEPIRTKETVQEADNLLMLGAAAYIASMWNTFWEMFPDKPDIFIQYVDSTPPHINVQIKGGKHLQQSQSVRIKLMTALWEIVRYPPDPFVFFETAELPGNFPVQRVPLFALGLFTGMSPYFEDGWPGRTETEFLDYMIYASKLLGVSTATYYEGTFLTEKYGTNADLYADNFILPPPASHQLHFCTRALFHIHGKYKEDPERVRKWIENLSTVPMQLFSLPALIARVSWSDGKQLSRVRSLIDTQQGLFDQCRMDLAFARSCLGEPGTIEEALTKGQVKEAEGLLMLEAQLEMIPWLYIPAKELLSRAPVTLAYSLSAREWVVAADVIEAVSNGEAHWLAQAALFACLQGDLPRARRLEILFSTSAVPLPKIMNMHFQAATAILEGKFGEAKDILERGLFQDAPADLVSRRVLARLLNSCYLALGMNAAIVSGMKRLFEVSELDVVLGTDLLDALAMEPDDEIDTEDILQHLFLLSPGDRRILQLLIRTLLQKSAFLEQPST